MILAIAEECRREGLGTLDWEEDKDCWRQLGNDGGGFQKGEPIFPFDTPPHDPAYSLGEYIEAQPPFHLLPSLPRTQPFIHRYGRDLFGNVYRIVQTVRGDDTEPAWFTVWKDVPEELIPCY